MISLQFVQVLRRQCLCLVCLFWAFFLPQNCAAVLTALNKCNIGTFLGITPAKITVSMGTIYPLVRRNPKIVSTRGKIYIFLTGVMTQKMRLLRTVV